MFMEKLAPPNDTFDERRVVLQADVQNVHLVLDKYAITCIISFVLFPMEI